MRRFELGRTGVGPCPCAVPLGTFCHKGSYASECSCFEHEQKSDRKMGLIMKCMELIDQALAMFGIQGKTREHRLRFPGYLWRRLLS